jgi:hypothetical protein
MEAGVSTQMTNSVAATLDVRFDVRRMSFGTVKIGGVQHGPRVFTAKNAGLAAQHGYFSVAAEPSRGIHPIIRNGSNRHFGWGEPSGKSVDPEEYSARLGDCV